jgi:superfamily II DNA helicase RecQ
MDPSRYAPLPVVPEEPRAGRVRTSSQASIQQFFDLTGDDEDLVSPPEPEQPKGPTRLEFLKLTEREVEGRARAALHGAFGLADFREGQLEVIRALLTGRDSMCLMPTGGGKSLCFQLPALVLGGVTVVISPLVALMADQVRRAQQIPGLRAASYSSNLPEGVKRDLLSGLKLENRQGLRLLYVTPEFVTSSRGLDVLHALREKQLLTLFAIDEVCCILAGRE